MRLCNTPFDCLALHRKSISIDLVLINNKKKKLEKLERLLEMLKASLPPQVLQVVAEGLASCRRDLFKNLVKK